MRGTRTHRAPFVALIALGLSASLTLTSCGGDDDASESTTGTTAPAADTSGSTGRGSIEASLSNGDGISGAPSECTLDGTTGAVVAEDGAFELTFTDGAGTLRWQHSDGELNEQATVMLDGSTISLSGVSVDGIGYNAEINC